MKFECNSIYLVFPVSHTAQKKKLSFMNKGTLVFDLEIELDYVCPDYSVYINIERFRGMEIELVCEPEVRMDLQTSDVKYSGMEFYHEKYRQQFHFSPKLGWINDPNGLVYYKGIYHLFFQHNPAGAKWGNMHWGHATSKDLVHWDELECSLYPDKLGTMFSGSAIVDKKNVAGLKSNENEVILLFYTAAGNESELSKGQSFTQCMAYSTDGGKVYKAYENNPLIPEIASSNRDPKVIYDEESDSYVMVLFLINNSFALLSSKNLLEWKQLQEISLEEDAECPDFYPLAVDSDKNNVKWVFSGASGKYFIGSFNGNRFKPETGTLRLRYGNNSYASQTWSDIEPQDGRRIRIAWDTCDIPAAYFNKSLSFPCEMTAKTVEDGIYLFTYPIKEIESLYKASAVYNDIFIAENTIYSLELNGKAYDINLKLPYPKKTTFGITFFGMNLECNTAENQLKCLKQTAPLASVDGALELRILIDTASVEIFINKGQFYLAHGFMMDFNINRLKLESDHTGIQVSELKVCEIKSIW